MTEDKEDKVRENRLRRMAYRQGLRLVKSRRRDPRALDYGSYALFDAETGQALPGAVLGARLRFTLDDVETYLTTPVPAMLGHGAVNRESARNRDAAQGAALNPRRRSRPPRG
jgi:hypothetical protein